MTVLFTPNRALLPGYIDALKRGWSPDNLRPEAAAEQLEAIAKDADAFLRRLSDAEGSGPPVTLPDGTQVARLPSFRRWIVRDGFAGTIGLRWQPGTTDLPPTCLGHIGYAVVPWRRREGLATAALIELLPEARALGLAHIDLTTDPDNRPSQRVIEAAGGCFVGQIKAPPQLGSGTHALFRISLAPA
ncbi:MAG: GNAT family N-acetyltransferase [Pseudomonadota bacterium]